MTSPRAALLVIDAQRDFCAGGALPVPGGDGVMAPLNRYLEQAQAQGLTIYASRDWHPPVTIHFASYGGPWPPHCVQHTDGAKFHADLRLPPSAIVITKGDAPDRHGYSDFEGHTPAGVGFLEDLRARGVDALYVGGLATDYCVRHTVLEALSHGLHVTVLEDAISGVDVKPGDSARAIAEMRDAGARFGTALPG